MSIMSSLSSWSLICLSMFVQVLGHVVIADEAQPKAVIEIREYARQLETPILNSLKRSRFTEVSGSWQDLSFDVDAEPAVPSQSWTGVPGYGTPVQLDADTIAVIEKKGGVAFTLWHLSPKGPAITWIADFNCDVPNRGGVAESYKRVVWHRQGDDLIGEFVRTSIERHGSRFDGYILDGAVNLRTGHTVRNRSGRIRLWHDEADLEARLLEKFRMPDNAVDLPPAEDVKTRFLGHLSTTGLAFDFNRGRFFVAPAERMRIVRLANCVTTDNQDVMNHIDETQAATRSLATCAAIRDLQHQLQLAGAVAAKDENALRLIAFSTPIEAGVDPQRLQAFRELAGFELLRLVACEKDQLEEYADFASQCDDSLQQPQNAAILRMHEILFRRACEDATVEAFDAFISKAPISVQAPRAREFAYALDKERIDCKLASSLNKDSAAEAMARTLYVDWRIALRAREFIKAERCFVLLSDHVTLKSTMAAVSAQDAEDEREFRTLLLADKKRQESLISEMSDVQKKQLVIMGDQLAESRAANAGLSVLNMQIDYMRGDVRQLSNSSEKTGQGVEAMRGGISRLGNSSEKTRQEVEAIRLLLKK